MSQNSQGTIGVNPTEAAPGFYSPAGQIEDPNVAREVADAQNSGGEEKAQAVEHDLYHQHEVGIRDRYKQIMDGLEEKYPHAFIRTVDKDDNDLLILDPTVDQSYFTLVGAGVMIVYTTAGVVELTIQRPSSGGIPPGFPNLKEGGTRIFEAFTHGFQNLEVSFSSVINDLSSNREPQVPADWPVDEITNLKGHQDRKPLGELSIRELDLMDKETQKLLREHNENAERFALERSQKSIANTPPEEILAQL